MTRFRIDEIVSKWPFGSTKGEIFESRYKVYKRNGRDFVRDKVWYKIYDIKKQKYRLGAYISEDAAQIALKKVEEKYGI